MFPIAQVVSALLLFIAVCDLPYDYYTLLRFVVCSISAYSAYRFKVCKKETWMWIFGVVAVLFNPLLKVHLERSTWQIINVAVGVLIFTSTFALLRAKKMTK